jgi:hypothetical protein
LLSLFADFVAGLIGHQVLFMIETVKAKLLVQGGQVLPAGASVYVMGVEMQHLPDEASPQPVVPHHLAKVSSLTATASDLSSSTSCACSYCPTTRPFKAVQQPDLQFDLSALDQFR